MDFVFSQSSLQDFNECRRRFFYRYIQKLAWPAPPAEPVFEAELAAQRGARFHHIVHQHLVGCPSGRIDEIVAPDPQLSAWWRNYQEYYRGFLLTEREQDGRFFPEITLMTAMDGWRVLAKYDLLVVRQDGDVWIVDWKTGNQKPGGKRRQNLAGRWQTVLYPWLLTRAGGSLVPGGIAAEKIEMIYWFAGDAAGLERYQFSQSQCREVEKHLAEVIEQIVGMDEGEFEKTANEHKCLYCPYRSLCDRGTRAGAFGAAAEDELEDADQDLDFDFAQVEELPYLQG